MTRIRRPFQSAIVPVAELKYVRQLYVNGEACDLTGRPRTVEVRYVCNEKMGLLSFIERLEVCVHVCFCLWALVSILALRARSMLIAGDARHRNPPRART